MSTSKSDYMLLFRGTAWDKGLSPEQIQKLLSDWGAWFARLTNEGKAIGGHPLRNEGKIVSGKKGRTVADGPFAESKEAIGGYFYLQVASEEEAVAIAQIHGPQAGIETIAAIQDKPSLASYYLLYAVLAEFESQLNDFQSAATHLRKAIQLTELKSEQSLLEQRLQGCEEKLQYLCIPPLGSMVGKRRAKLIT